LSTSSAKNYSTSELSTLTTSAIALAEAIKRFDVRPALRSKIAVTKVKE